MSTAGEIVELRRYRIPAGERAVRAQRIDGRVAVTDVPVDYPDRVYLVERHVHSYAELQSLADEYAHDSQSRGHPAIGSRADASTRRTHAPAVQSPSRAV